MNNNINNINNTETDNVKKINKTIDGYVWYG